ncbi:F-box protein SKP2A-like isoform X2 [Phoenix dactylifera]|nr:F-box protein SKP2A-like isoform X2 [Phoenix dactylifera]XP_026664928.2 F-box protein SKP2A-like isoform X2 [Phoenix dactylifera]XP_026664929.2 F-box protein SKP2A-like isoform X2 [Phoenix dactylifera]
MVSGGLGSGNLEAWFQNLMLSAGGEKSGGEGAAMAGWKDLPMELLLRIISLLDDRTVIVVSGVCTGWRDALCFGLTNLSLSWCTNNMNSLVQSLAPKFTKLQVLTLRQDRPQLEDIAVEAVANYCHDLRDLDLSKSFRLTDCSLYALAHGCPRLTKLNISGCSAFSDSALAYLTSYCRNLKNLNLCGCVRAATDRALQAIAYNCIQLQTLNLGWCEDISDNGVTSLAAGCPDLRALDLCGCVLITVMEASSVFWFVCVDDQSLVTLGSSTRRCRRLIRTCWSITGALPSRFRRDQLLSTWGELLRTPVPDESVIALANGCPRLRSLGLYYCQNITDRAMYSLANSRVKSKRELRGPMQNSSDEKEGLMKLNISQCTALTPPAVQAVCDSFPALHTCPERHSLIISGCLNLTSVHCACALQAQRPSRVALYPHAY